MFDKNDDLMTHVGYLNNGEFNCLQCQGLKFPHREKSVRIFLVNILPYKQSCSICGKLIVKSPQLGWPNLFE